MSVVDGQLLREIAADGFTVLLGLLVVFAFWALCALVYERASRRRERAGL